MTVGDYFRSFSLVSILIICAADLASAADVPIKDRGLSLDEFTRLAAANDTEFEAILIDQLALKYQKELRLPPGDLILSVKQQYKFYIIQDRQAPATSVSLSRLFPNSGTAASISYQAGSSMAAADDLAGLSLAVTQPIARNAFGRSTNLLDKIVGLEVDVARYQIVEAYEDYLAAIMAAYYTWYEDYMNLGIGRSSYRENLKLLDNIKERQGQKIALAVDVNKVKLQVLVKQERLVELEKKLADSLQIIKRVLRYQAQEQLKPIKPPSPTTVTAPFDRLFEHFSKDSRTFDMLRKLEQRSSLEVAKDADDLLPSINLIAGYEVRGEQYRIQRKDDLFFAGISIDWPFPNRVKKAQHALSIISVDKAKLTTRNTYHRLYTQLISLYLKIELEGKLLKISDEKLALARAVVKDEQENYSFGKVTLNDYIQAVNSLDTNRFSKVFHESLNNKLLIEWLRLMDSLVNQNDIK